MKIYDDPIEFIKTNPKMFLRGNNIGLELSSNIVSDVILLTGGPLIILHKHNWWIIGCEKDWLEENPNHTIDEAFSIMIPFPEAGQNSIRGEILLTAFAQNIITVVNGLFTTIKGHFDEEDNVLINLINSVQYKRILAFSV